MFNLRKKREFLTLLIAPLIFSSFALASEPSAPSSIGATKASVYKTSSVRLSFLDNADNEDHYDIMVKDYDSGVVHERKTINAISGSDSYGYATLSRLKCNNVYKAVIRAVNAEGEYSENDRLFNIHSTFGVSCDDFEVDIGDDRTASISESENNEATFNFHPSIVKNSKGYEDIRGHWKIISAPENYNATFVPPYDYLTSFVSKTPGVYILKLSAHFQEEPEVISVDTIKVTVTE